MLTFKKPTKNQNQSKNKKTNKMPQLKQTLPPPKKPQTPQKLKKTNQVKVTLNNSWKK